MRFTGDKCLGEKVSRIKEAEIGRKARNGIAEKYPVMEMKIQMMQ